MGAIGIHLDFEPGGKAKLDELIIPIWDLVLEFIRTRAFAGHSIREYAADLKYDAVAKGRFVADDKRIGFFFPDLTGLCVLSMYATHHWTRLALASRSDEVDALAAAHGQRLLGPRLDLATELASGPQSGVLVLANKQWWLATEGSVVGDDKVAKLTATKKRYVEAALRLRWCECVPCVGLRRERAYALRERQGWTSALIAQWVCRQLGVSHEDLARNQRGKQLARARAAASFLITEEGPDDVSHRSLLGQSTTSSLLIRGMEVVKELGLALPDDPAAP